MLKPTIFIVFIFLTNSIFAQNKTINIKQLSPKVYVHESFLDTEEWGKVSCNGMIFVNDGEAIIFDTPANNEASNQLIRIVEDSLKAKIVGVLVNHFHEDCLGGLKAFHQRLISTYANLQTIALAKSNGFSIPVFGFKKKLTLKVGGEKVQNFYFGPAHTQDNIVSYIPSEKVLFGGCMVKALGASKGNLADADTTQWSHTIKKVMKLQPKIVIPGHGKVGGPELLTYTEKLFN
ncbi:MAG: subclass B1 metallo-beta-lactamase [Pelobium sp.]